MNKKNNFRAILGALLLFLTGCSFSSGAPTEIVKNVSPSKPSTVAVATASRESVREQITVAGEFRPYQTVDIHAKVAGYLREIGVDVGSRVAAGQVLANLEIPEMRDDVAFATAELRRAEAEMMRARGELERAEANLSIVELSYQRLVKVMKAEPGLIAQQEIDEALGRKRVAEAQLSGARAAIGAAEQDIEGARAKQNRTRTLTDYTTITAPFAGVVTKRFADPGALVPAGTSSNAVPLVRIADVSRLRLVVPVAESASSKIRLGSSLEVRVTSLNKTFTGRVARFGGDVSLATRTMDVEIDVANPGGALMPGMYAEVTLTLRENSDALLVPLQAVSYTQGKKAVMLVTVEGLLEERTVHTGIETASKVEVTSGLKTGDMVVVGSKTQLRIGDKVSPKVGG